MKPLVPLTVAARLLGVSRQTLWRMVCAGEARAVRTSRGKRARIYILRAWLIDIGATEK